MYHYLISAPLNGIRAHIPRWEPESRFIVYYCGMVMTLIAFAVDTTIPLLGELATAFNVSIVTATQTFTVFLLGFGFGQLLMGTLSDRIGRKPALAISLVVFIIGGALVISAELFSTVLVGRLLQGIGCAGGSVIGRAMMRDLYVGNVLASKLATAMIVFALGPILAPIISALVGQYSVWQLAFAIQIGYGVMLLAFILAIPETNTSKDATALSPTHMWKGILAVFRHPIARRYLIGAIGGMIAITLIIGQISVVLTKNFAASTWELALVLAGHGIGIVVGGFVNRAAIGRYGARHAAIVGTGLMFFPMAVLLITVILLPTLVSVTFIGVCFFVFAGGHMTTISNCTALALVPFGNKAGLVSALIGFVGTVTTSIFAIIITPILAGDLLRWSAMLSIVCLAAFLLVATARDFPESDE